MKIGVIGLGDIAQKAYLPCLSSMGNIEIHLYTRNQEKLTDILAKYRFSHAHKSLDSLLESGIQAAFVHSSTESHEQLIEVLLDHDIHVYVDKPITYHFHSSKRLIEKAQRKKLILMTGFNRRYAPSYVSLKKQPNPNMILMQKNRLMLPEQIRTFIFDDFIHVVDTVRFLLSTEVDQFTISGKIQDGLLHHVTVQFTNSQTTAIAVMNRNSGVNEEIVEVMSPTEKRTVYNVSELVEKKDRVESIIGTGDWERTLYKRGFEQIIDAFLKGVASGNHEGFDLNDSLKTHEICEQIVQFLEGSSVK